MAGPGHDMSEHAAVLRLVIRGNPFILRGVTRGLDNFINQRIDNDAAVQINNLMASFLKAVFKSYVVF